MAPHPPNALLAAAQPLLTRLAQLKLTKTPSSRPQQVKAFREQQREFERALSQAGYEDETCSMSTYLLNTCLTAILTQALPESPDARPAFAFNDKRFFTTLEKLCRAPRKHADVLELAYVCFTLALDESTPQYGHWATLKNQMYQLILTQHENVERQLSPSVFAGKTPTAAFRLPFRRTLVWLLVLFVTVLGCTYFSANVSLRTSSRSFLETLKTVAPSHSAGGV